MKNKFKSGDPVRWMPAGSVDGWNATVVGPDHGEHTRIRTRRGLVWVMLKDLEPDTDTDWQNPNEWDKPPVCEKGHDNE